MRGSSACLKNSGDACTIALASFVARNMNLRGDGTETDLVKSVPARQSLKNILKASDLH